MIDTPYDLGGSTAAALKQEKKKDEMDLESLEKELHGEVENNKNNDDDDPFAEGNYIRRA